MGAPSVSIVVPAFNEEGTIRRCLLAAANQTVSADEILVVDNRSTDGTRAEVESVIEAFPNAHIRLLSQHSEQGLVPTRNAGLDAAGGEVLGRIDADSAIMPDWVEQVKLAFAQNGFAAASGPVVYYDMPLRTLGHQADDAIRRFQGKLSGENGFLFGSNMALTRSAWQTVRDDVCPDREDLMHEDLDLAVHLVLRGLKIGYVSAMVAGISARRMDDKPREFRSYVQRFERTYAAHGIRDVRLLAPMAVFFGIYPAVHLTRQVARLAPRRA